MAHFSNAELLCPQRLSLPAVHVDAERSLNDASVEANSGQQGLAGGGGGGHGDDPDPFFDPMNRRWRLSTGDDARSAAAVRPNQRLQYLCLQEVIRSILVRDKRNCPLGFESNFAQILADLMEVKFCGQVRQQQQREEAQAAEKMPLKKRARGADGCQHHQQQPDSPTDEPPSYPASFLEFQRIIRTNIFFSPYLKYTFQLNIISKSLSEEKVRSLNPHYFSQTSSSGQGHASCHADGTSVSFYANVTKDQERDCACLKVTYFGLPSFGMASSVVAQMLAEFTNGEAFLHRDHALFSFQSYFQCLPRRVRANRDLVKFSATFPKGFATPNYSDPPVATRTGATATAATSSYSRGAVAPAVTWEWREYLEKTLFWCDRLMADSALLCETPGDAATLRPRVDVRRPVEETRTKGPRNHRDMIHYKSVNYQDQIMEDVFL